MSQTREILTLQFGNFTNYVGAHLWNIQECSFNYDENADSGDINHDILFREGVNSKGQTTYTPRMLLVDFKNSLKCLSEYGDLYNTTSQQLVQSAASITDDNQIDDIKETMEWDANVDVINTSEIELERHEYQKDLIKCDTTKVNIMEKNYNFAETVESWTDFLYSRYHQRTVTQLKTLAHTPNENTFDCFSAGSELWNTDNFDDGFSDKIRQYIEECNNCQGFQMMYDCSDGFTGLATKCLENLMDDYRKTVLTIPIFSPKLPKFQNADQIMSDSMRIVNIALSYANQIELSSLILPVSTMTGDSTGNRQWRSMNTRREIPLLNYHDENIYQSSAIIASYIDTITLRYRLCNPTHSNHLSNFCTDLNNYGRKLCAAGIALPFHMLENQDLIDTLDQQGETPLFTQLSPNSKIGNESICQSVCLRGIPKDRLKKPKTTAKHQMRMSAYRCESVSEMLQLYFECNLNASQTHVTSIGGGGMTTKKPFPIEMFDERLNSSGFLCDFPSTNRIESVPILAVAQTSNDLIETIETLHSEAARIQLSKMPRFKDTGLENDEYIEALEKLLEFKDVYENNFLI